MSNAETIPDIYAAPAEGQRVKHNNVVYTTIREGMAHILVPEESKTKDGQTVQQVFYNPIQQFNRDLTVLAIKAYGKERLEQKKAASKSRESKWGEKKRKRKEAAQTERPAKSPKLENVAAEGEDTEMKDVTEQPAEQAADQQAERSAEAAQQEEQASEQATEGTAQPPADKPKKEPQPQFRILDALSASGLRALRYAQEVPFATSVTANDLLKTAAEAIERNVMHNGLVGKIRITVDDAIAHMYEVVVKDLRRVHLSGGKPGPSEKYDVIDLDPYGSAAPFLDAAVQAVRDDGGLLCITCTDSGVWASNGYPEKCYSLYGGIPVKGWYSHEVGLRLILHAIEAAANKYGLAMEPLLSLSVDFYCRVFVRIRKSPATVKFAGGKTMILYSCGGGCGSWTTQLLMKNKPAPNKKGTGIFYKHGFTKAPTTDSKCEHCGSTMHLAGPMYAGRLHSQEFIKAVIAETEAADPKIYGTKERIRGVLQTALEEYLPTAEMQEEDKKQEEAAKKDESRRIARTGLTEAQAAAYDPYPFYFHPQQISGILHCASPSEAAIRGALLRMGYRVTRSHCKAGSMKTDAPWYIIWHVFREWVRQKAPIKVENIKPGSVAYRLLRLGGNKEVHEDKTEESGKDQQAAKADEAKPEEEDDQEDKQQRKELPEVVFDEQLGRYKETVKYLRYQMNPRENWGPMNRARGK
ncbi:N,N-dimethylguanosine tRNA methyltransferase-like protein [Thermochaetoides thermophila DSM 1495]|uniref:tRNA (guanine(26)-N(2))-dimethyltransferase n=1 Tax=Chaetomium thermophilum (strain DSM 1495 / CBS 144.50 / IMI 039719) TaxID=759272 RepID=G0S8J4_CHATD|nr:N,N-dimethylguanosine tRNA methyltransferase-like protein [Thermochaetoides thermophila DSM 1495]EGS21954.1 N,N-dimethylguanosine tRNA methyltransferase-like protein [Thermochaetoides thermophila DSM 1495]